mgnify:CR=1 FL=1
MSGADGLEVALNCGKTIGGLTGLGLGIWALVDYVQPALSAEDGISETGASWITAGIALLGGLGVTIGIGACAGSLLACIVFSCGSCCGSCCSRSNDSTTAREPLNLSV